MTLLVLAACGGGGGGSSASNPQAPTGSEPNPPTTITTTTTELPVLGPKASGLSNITVTPSASTVSLSWPAVTGSALYRVYRLDNVSASAEGAGAVSEALAPLRTEVCQTTETSCVDGVNQSLAELTTYRYVVEALKSDGSLIASNDTVQASTLGRNITPDKAPELASAMVEGISNLTLRWNAVRGASYYIISGGNLAGEKKVVGTSLVDMGLDPSVTYTYHFKACSSLGACTEVQTFTVNTGGIAISVPEAPSLALGQAYANSLSLTWRPVAWAQTYKLSRDGAEVAAALTSAAFTDTGLESGKSYSYTLQACNSLGCSPLSTPLKVSTVVVYPVQAQVRGLDTTRSGADLSISATLGNRTEMLTVKSGETLLGAIPEGTTYALRILRQPANGQVCRVTTTGQRSVERGTNTAAIDCQTSVALTYPQTSYTLPLSKGLTQAAPQNPVAQVGTTVLSPAPSSGWTYSSSNPAVVQVAQDGALTPVAPGQAQISAALNSEAFTSGGKVATYNVTIAAPAPVTPGVPAVRPAAETVAVARLDLTQIFAQESDSPYAVLVPGRQVMVRTYLRSVTDKPVAPPKMTLTAIGADEAEQKLDMVCPAEVPAADSALNIYDKAGACYGTITDLDLIKKDMKIVVASGDGTIERSLSPSVNTKGVLNIHMVPVEVESDLATLPNFSDYSKAVLRALPFASVKMTSGNTYKSSLSSTDSNLFSATLSALASLSAAEGGKRHWYGFMPKAMSLGDGWFTTGLGYVGGNMGSAVGVVNERTFLHEVGHNLNLSHAPCGGVSRFDPVYSKDLWEGASKGLLSGTPIFDNTSNEFVNPLLGLNGSNTDIMGYCNGKWLSEYGYWRAAKYIQSNNSQKYVEQGDAGAVATGEPVLYVSGSINTAGQVGFNPTQLFQTGRVTDEGGDYILRVQMRNGSVYEQRFDAHMLGDDETMTLMFGVKIPRLDGIARMDVVYGGNLLATQSMVAPTSVTAQGVGGPVGTTVKAAGASLQLGWDSRRWPWAALTHVAPNGERTALVARATLGQAKLALPSDLPAGGRWEVSLSDGLNSQLVMIKR